MPFLIKDTGETKDMQGFVSGSGDIQGSVKIMFPDGSTWTVPRSKILRLSQRKRSCVFGGGDVDEQDAPSGWESIRMQAPVASRLLHARAEGPTQAAGNERFGWRAQLRQRGIEEASDPAYGSYGKAPRYENGDALSYADLQWWMWNKPRRGEDGAGEALLDGEWCEGCGEGGELMVCDGPMAQWSSCVDGRSRAFHCGQCLQPPLARPPAGRWMCRLCQRGMGGPGLPVLVQRDAVQPVGIADSDLDCASPAPQWAHFSESDLGLVRGPSGSGNLKTTVLQELSESRPPTGAAPACASVPEAPVATLRASEPPCPGGGWVFCRISNARAELPNSLDFAPIVIHASWLMCSRPAAPS